MRINKYADCKGAKSKGYIKVLEEEEREEREERRCRERLCAHVCGLKIGPITEISAVIHTEEQQCHLEWNSNTLTNIGLTS